MRIFRLDTVNSPEATFQKNLFEELPQCEEIVKVGRLKQRAILDIEYHFFVYINTGG